MSTGYDPIRDYLKAMPMHIMDKLNRLKKIQRQLTQKLERQPPPQELAETMQMEWEQFEKLLTQTHRPISLDQLIGKEEDTLLSAIIAMLDHTRSSYAV